MPRSSTIYSLPVSNGVRSSSAPESTSSLAPTSPGGGEPNPSIAHALTSVGVPSSIVAPLVSAITGSPSEVTPQGTGLTASNESQQQQKVAALEAFLRWLLSFFT